MITHVAACLGPAQQVTPFPLLATPISCDRLTEQFSFSMRRAVSRAELAKQQPLATSRSDPMRAKRGDATRYVSILYRGRLRQAAARCGRQWLGGGCNLNGHRTLWYRTMRYRTMRHRTRRGRPVPGPILPTVPREPGQQGDYSRQHMTPPPTITSPYAT